MNRAEEEEQARLERARAIGLSRYMLIREAAGPVLPSRQRGAMVRALAAREHADPSGQPVRLTRWIRLWRDGGGTEEREPSPDRGPGAADPPGPVRAGTR